MGHQIIKQPNGLLSVFSSVTDSFILTEATPGELVGYYRERAAEEAERAVTKKIDLVLAGRPGDAYHQFALTYEQAKAMSEKQDQDDEDEAAQ